MKTSYLYFIFFGVSNCCIQTGNLAIHKPKEPIVEVAEGSENLANNFNSDDLVNVLKLNIKDDDEMESVGKKIGDTNEFLFNNIRLNGNSKQFGIVEVEINGEWGTICDDFLPINPKITAEKICSFIGISGPAKWFSSDAGNIPQHLTVEPSILPKIWLDDLFCFGNETNILQCHHRYPGRHNCKASENIGVYCGYSEPSTLPVYTGGIRLVGASRSNIGYLEVNYDGTWGGVCDDGFTEQTATEICRFLGFTNARGQWFSKERRNLPQGVLINDPGEIAKLWLDDISCDSSAENIDQCDHGRIGNHNCVLSEAVGIICSRFSLINQPSDPVVSDQQLCGTNRYQNYNQSYSSVIGGNDARPHEYPWIVQVLKNGRFICGGSIISESYILTAAHCVESNSSFYHVEVGAHRRSRRRDEHSVTMGVQSVIIHPEYQPQLYRNDFALLLLTSPLSFQDNWKPICLPQSCDQCPSGSAAKISGWGSTNSTVLNLADALQSATVIIASDLQCRNQYSPNRYFSDSMLCAGATRGGIDTCRGDSGGPLMVISSDNAAILCGVTSWGWGCASAEHFGVYSKVCAVVPWVSRIANF